MEQNSKIYNGPNLHFTQEYISNLTQTKRTLYKHKSKALHPCNLGRVWVKRLTRLYEKKLTLRRLWPRFQKTHNHFYNKALLEEGKQPVYNSNFISSCSAKSPP